MLYTRIFFFFSSRRRHTRLTCDWSSDVCSSDLIDTFVELATVKTPRSSGELLRERVMVQALTGEAEALLRSGRALLFEVVEEMWQAALAKEPITERQRSDLRMAMTHAARSEEHTSELQS